MKSPAMRGLGMQSRASRVKLGAMLAVRLLGAWALALPLRVGGVGVWLAGLAGMRAVPRASRFLHGAPVPDPHGMHREVTVPWTRRTLRTRRVVGTCGDSPMG